MQTFKTLNVLNPLLNRYDMPDHFYDIICTPGNTLFTSFMLPILKTEAFFILSILFAVVVSFFMYVLIREIVGNRLIATAAALFSILNPYVLSIEVLDRNIMAFALSTVLLYALQRWKDKHIVIGVIFGLLAGTGLRFLPLLFGIPIIILFIRDKKGPKAYIQLIVSFLVTFAFNLPHLRFHGLHSLGENMSVFQLFFISFTQWLRTPFMPFPNAIFYAVNIIDYFGLIICVLVVFGLCAMLKHDKWFCVSLASVVALMLLVLSIQRDWIEGDKSRIIVEAFAPIFIFLAYGLRTFIRRSWSLKKVLVLILSIVLPVSFVSTTTAMSFDSDSSFYIRRYMFQKETSAYYSFIKQVLNGFAVYPNYSRNHLKYDIVRKKNEEYLAMNRLFSKNNYAKKDIFRHFYSSWEASLFYKKIKQAHDDNQHYLSLAIDFNKLISDLKNAVQIVDTVELYSMDLMQREDLFSVYYSGIDVSWQKNTLPICVIVDKEQYSLLRELYIECNAFKSYGTDNLGLDIINPIFSQPYVDSHPAMMNSGMSTFPLFEEEGIIYVRIPEDSKIIIRNWFIDGSDSTPYKIDGWIIEAGGDNTVSISFAYNEPESYL